MIYSKDDQVINAVVETYETIYFDKTLKSNAKAQNLISLMRTATLTDTICIEELIAKMIQKEIIDKEVFKHLFTSYT